MKKTIFALLVGFVLLGGAQFASAETVSAGKVILVGGDSMVTSSDGRTKHLNDVWSSSGDLATWNQVLPDTSTVSRLLGNIVTEGSITSFQGNLGPADGQPLDTVYLNGKLYLLNGDMTGASLWTSLNEGVTWTKIATLPWARGNGRLVALEGKLFAVGVRTPMASYDGSSYEDSQVWSSSDGISWTKILARTPWGERAGFPVVAFQGKLWVLGGTVYADDAWSSSDGKKWTKTVVPWSGRLYHSAVVFNNTLWMFGGKDLSGPFSDGWSSSDGIHWKKVTGATPWEQNMYSALVSYGNAMVMFPGYTNDVWSSTDGVSWTRIPTSSANSWMSRIGAAAVVIGGSESTQKSTQVSVGNPTSKIVFSSKNVRFGQTHTAVKDIQNYLISKGYLSGSATGYYGSLTKAALAKLQKELGIAGDGSNFGPLTRAAIENKK
jgi:hypothetical protein